VYENIEDTKCLLDLEILFIFARAEKIFQGEREREREREKRVANQSRISI
jgi:hypothetical protein